MSIDLLFKIAAIGILVDGLGVGDVGNIVLRDRQHLAQDGLIVIVLTMVIKEISGLFDTVRTLFNL